MIRPAIFSPPIFLPLFLFRGGGLVLQVADELFHELFEVGQLVGGEHGVSAEHENGDEAGTDHGGGGAAEDELADACGRRTKR